MSRKGRSEVQKQLDMVRVSQCRALGDCAQVLHQTGLELADDAKALLQVFTAVQQRLQKLELAQRRSNPASSHDLLAGLRHVVGKESLAVSAAEIKQPEPEAAEQQQQQQQQSPPSLREIGLPELRKILDVGNNGSSDASQTGSLVWLMRGSKVTKVNRKNLQTADVHLFLSIEGATPAEPGWICARKVKDGSLSRIPLSEVRRVYNGVEYSETLHRYTQKLGKNCDYQRSSFCISFFAGSTAEHSRTFDFICGSTQEAHHWLQFLDPRASSSSNSVKTRT